MKKIFRRIYLDIIRKPLSFISKIAVFAVLFSLLFTSLVIKSISKNMQTDFFDKMKIYVSITSNINDIQFQSNSSQSYLTQFEDYYKMINKLSKNENILFHDLNISTNNHYFPLKFIEVSPETNTISFIYPHSNSLENNEIEQYAQCLLNEKVCFYPTLPLRSVQNVEFLDLRFNSIDVPIVSDNRTFTQTEIDEGENVCLVPYGYSLYTYENGNLSEKILKNGDIIYISEFVKDNQGKYLYVKKHEFKIIGFYNQTESGEIYNQSFYSINPIYVPEKALIPLLETSLNQTKKLNPSDYDILFNSSYNSMFIHPVIFQLNDIEGLKTFLKDFETNCSYDDYKLFSTVSSSLITISNIRSVSNSFNYISIISLAVCILISIMVLLIDISHRRNEIGILLSFGA